MTSKDSQLEDAAELRRQAEKIAQERAARRPENPEALSPEETRQTLHELQVHQIELEMQNEELRRAHVELDASRARYFDLYDLAPVGYFSLSEHGLILEANLTAADLLGVARSALAKQPLPRFILPADENIYYRHRKQLLETGEPQVCELRMLRANAAPFWARLEASAVQDGESGEPVFRAVVSDIDDMKRCELAVRQSHDELHAIYDGTLDGIIVADAETKRFVRVNPAMCQMLGYSEEEILSMSVMEIHPPTAVRAILEQFKAMVEGRLTVAQGCPLLRKDGTEIYADIACKLVVFNGRPCGVGFFHDITARKQAEDIAEKAKAVAEQANRAKDHFLAALSHELRTPLTPVVLGVSMLQDRLDLDPAARETLEMVRRNVEMESRLIDDLLDVARIARGTLLLTRRPVDLGSVINEAIDVCKPDIEARGVELGVDLGSGWPYWVEADVSRLRQVFWNLLKNAVKFTPNGGRIAVRCQPDGSHVRIEVTDSGIGIEPESLSRIFTAFEQGNRSTARQFGGLGLGLTISRTLVEMHDGTISAHSDGPGKGATFRVRLPLTTPAGQPDALLPTAPRKHAAHPLRILLVEDHGVTSRMMRMVLTEAGHTVETAGDVATGLELAHQRGFDLLLSDLGLPDGSGHDLMRQLRARGHQFPGIALSGYGQEDDIQRSHEAGFSAHLTKPASREAVLEAVAAATAGQSATAVTGPTVGEGATDPAEVPVFDVDAALKRCFGKLNFLKNMADHFLAESPALLEHLRGSLDEQNAAEVAATAHRLAGTLTYLGATKTVATAQEIVKIGRSGDLSPATEAIARLDQQVTVLKESVSEWSKTNQ